MCIRDRRIWYNRFKSSAENFSLERFVNSTSAVSYTHLDVYKRQVVTQGQGSALISSRAFYEEVEITRRQMQEDIKERTGGTKNYLFDHMDEAFVKEMEDVRLGKMCIRDSLTAFVY